MICERPKSAATKEVLSGGEDDLEGTRSGMRQLKRGLSLVTPLGTGQIRRNDGASGKEEQIETAPLKKAAINLAKATRTQTKKKITPTRRTKARGQKGGESSGEKKWKKLLGRG